MASGNIIRARRDANGKVEFVDASSSWIATSTMEIYSDGSVKDNAGAKWGGSGIARFEDGWWIGKSFGVGKGCTPCRAEIRGICEAVSWAVDLLVAKPGSFTEVIVLCDSTDAMNECCNFFTTPPSGAFEWLGLMFLYRVRALRLHGAQLVFQWVKGHSGNDGNDCADDLAKRGSAAALEEGAETPRSDGVAESHLAARPFSATEQCAITSDLGRENRRPRSKRKPLNTSITRNNGRGVLGANTGAGGDSEDEKHCNLDGNKGLSEASAENDEEEEITYCTAACHGRPHRQYMKAQGKQVTTGALGTKKKKDLPPPIGMLLKIAQYLLPTTVRMCADYGFYSQPNYVDSFIDCETIPDLRAVLNLRLTLQQLESIAQKTVQNYLDNRHETLHVVYATEWQGSRNKLRLDIPIYEFIQKFRTLRVDLSFNFGYFPHTPEPDLEHTIETLSITVTRHRDSWRVLLENKVNECVLIA
ncbi:hypothetical protein TI39_contig4202g00045 [Zymoseptoria brevis]|uniref:RNase H type-1 domain-containing protein n=1 Tax=Zymoseptoria brevis TaxID=1047168 RepID=A0A0F4GBC0_9PEZI|nr:hypothetical protein TI39_contig4202g00045 [Zymoseptoria brevis]